MPPTIEDCVTYYESLGIIDKFLMPYKITFIFISSHFGFFRWKHD